MRTLAQPRTDVYKTVFIAKHGLGLKRRWALGQYSKSNTRNSLLVYWPWWGVNLGLLSKSNQPSTTLGGGGWTLDFSESQIDPQNAWKTHDFRLLAALLEGLLELLGGVGPWTFPNVQSTLWEGGVGPWTFQKVQPTLREGGVGPWTLKKSETR